MQTARKATRVASMVVSFMDTAFATSWFSLALRKGRKRMSFSTRDTRPARAACLAAREARASTAVSPATEPSLPERSGWVASRPRKKEMSKMRDVVPPGSHRHQKAAIRCYIGLVRP